MAAIAFVVVILLSLCPSIGSARVAGDLASPAVPEAASEQSTPEATGALPFQYEEEPSEEEPEEEPEEGEEIEEEPPPEDANMPPEEPPERD